MKVLVTAASKHGSTAEIARAIGELLTSAGVEADVRPPDEVTTLLPYDGVVLGSGVYAGRWLDTAKELVDREARAFGSIPVWLFSSGPLGDPLKPAEEPSDVAPIRERTGALDHRVFPGRLMRRKLGLAEKAIVAVVHAPDGDFRDWDSIIDWTAGIVRTLRSGSPAPAAG
jgi:menaquinone-dependent protoporphyrinogen oxidase